MLQKTRSIEGHIRTPGHLSARVGLVLTLLMAMWGLSTVPVAGAEPITVCATGCDYPTIQAAIDAASTRDGDRISIVDPVHTEADIHVHKSVVLFGASASSTVVQARDKGDAANGRVLAVQSDVRVTVQDVTIRHGEASGIPAQGGAVLNHGRLTLQRVTVIANSAVGTEGAPGGTAEGGGIYNDGSLTLIDSAIGGNQALGGDGAYSGTDGGEGRGGGIANGDEGTLTVFNSTISDNTVKGGAGEG